MHRVIKQTLREFVKFCVVGFLGMALNIGLLYLFTELFGFHYLLSAVFSFFFATLNNYSLNKVWTFNRSLKSDFTKDYVKFFIVSVTALIANLGILYSLTETMGIYYLFSQIIAIAATTIINFLGNKLFTFSERVNEQ